MPTLFNHALMNEAAPPNTHLLDAVEEGCGDDPQEELGLDTLPGRVLCCSEPDDVVQLPYRLMYESDHIMAHYGRIGLPVASRVQYIHGDELSLYRTYPNHALSTFIFGESAHRERPDEQWFRTAHKYLSKNAIMRLCSALGVRIPHTLCYEASEQHPLDACAYPVYAKSSRGVGGHGNILCRNAQELDQALVRIGPHVAYQVQEVIDAAGFYSIAYSVEAYKAVPWVLTKQRIVDDAWAGSIHPTDHTLAAVHGVAGPVAQQMADEGMRGVFNIDLALGRDGQWYVIETNPRFTASMYPSVAAQRLGVECWQYKVYPTNHRTLATLQLGALEFNPETRRGAVIVDWGSVLAGHLGVLLADDASASFTKGWQTLQHVLS